MTNISRSVSRSYVDCYLVEQVHGRVALTWNRNIGHTKRSTMRFHLYELILLSNKYELNILENAHKHIHKMDHLEMIHTYMTVATKSTVKYINTRFQVGKIKRCVTQTVVSTTHSNSQIMTLRIKTELQQQIVYIHTHTHTCLKSLALALQQFVFRIFYYYYYYYYYHSYASLGKKCSQIEHNDVWEGWSVENMAIFKRNAETIENIATFTMNVCSLYSIYTITGTRDTV